MCKASQAFIDNKVIPLTDDALRASRNFEPQMLLKTEYSLFQYVSMLHNCIVHCV